jgi:hypothetical protein
VQQIWKGDMGVEVGDRAYGAYGFRFLGLDEAAPLLNEVPADWPTVEVRQETGPADASELRVGSEDADLALITGGRVLISRRPPAAVFSVPEPLTVEEMVHPYLAPVGSVLALWRGWLPFHSSAIVVAGRAWGIVGGREVGKSTLAASFAVRDLPVVTDDVLVVGEDRFVYAGPRTLDLRRSAASHLGLGHDLGVVGMRERWRLGLTAVPDSVPLGGWVFLAWGDEVKVERCGVANRLRCLAESRSVGGPGTDPQQLLRLTGLPAFDYVRPRDWDISEKSVDRLIEVLGSVG